MPNSIKYSTTGDTLSLKKGNFFIGVGDVGKGPSNLTGHYQGITPPPSGYTIYVNTTGSQTSIFCANSDAELIRFTNGFSGQNFITATQCLNWYATQTNYVCVNEDYESIVTNGLVLNLDAGFTPSYTSSGTTWYDLSYSGNNGTLVNGPTFDSANGGSIVFDGVNDWVNCGNSLDSLVNLSLECWVNSGTQSASYAGLISKTLNNSDGWEIRTGFNFSPTQTFVQFRYKGNSAVASQVTLDNNRWYHLLATGQLGSQRLYVNGTLSVSTFVNTTPNPNSNNLSIGKLAYSTLYFNGKIPIARIYDRALGSSEVLQNYQAQFPRFLGQNIVMNGLVNFLDAGYNGSYPGTGTTWTNVSGVSGGTGTLVNGPTYSALNGGSIVFDGTNDYVDCGSGSSLNLKFLTLDCWVNPSIVSGGNGAHRHLIAYELCYKVRFNGDSVQVLLGNGTTWHTYIDTNFGIINANSWYNVTVNVTPLNICNIYINGVLTKTQNTSDIGNNGRKLFIGAYDAGGGTPFGFFNGKMSSSSIYERALTQSEILQNYQAKFPQILGENIITNGLVLYLDAGYTSSYPGTGTTWNNVSGVSGGTGTLTNGPTYDSANGGSIVFDGIDDFINCGNNEIFNLDKFTINFWVSISESVTKEIILKNSNSNNGVGPIEIFQSGNRIAHRINASNTVTSTNTMSLNTWYFISLTYDRNNRILYFNSLVDTVTPFTSATNTSTGNFTIGAYGNALYPFKGKISSVSIYNRALTQNEITQNFNAQKSRFGL